MKITDADLASGIAFLTLAAGFGIPAFGYGLGTTLRLGPGAFPLVLSVLLGIVGGCLVLRSLAGHRGEPIKPIDLRAAFMIILALCFGALTMRNVGILVAVPGAIIIAGLASRRFKIRPALWSSLALVAFTWLVFVKALQVRLPLLAGIF